jgi:hypothetical protein
MRLLLGPLLLLGCQHTLYQAPQTGDAGFIRISHEASGMDHSHRTAVALKGPGTGGWAHLTRQGGVRVRPGRQRVRFEGEFFEVVPPTPHEHSGECWSCASHLHPGSSDVGAAYAGVALLVDVVSGIAEAVEHAESMGGETIHDRCSADIEVEVGADDDIELVFRHSGKGECAIECWEHAPAGPEPCRSNG